MEEIWKPIPDHPGYEVSDFGHVRNTKTGRAVKTYQVKGKNQVVLYHDGKATSALVHNLVISAFRPRTESEKGMIVRHKNGVASDDRLDNLELIPGNRRNKARHVYAYQCGMLVSDFNSVYEAAKYIHGSAGSIRNVCMGIGKSYRTYEWSYYPPDQKEDAEVARDQYYLSRGVYKYHGPDGYETLVGVYDNYMQAAEMNGVNPDSILNCCLGVSRKAGGYGWEFMDKYSSSIR